MTLWYFRTNIVKNKCDTNKFVSSYLYNKRYLLNLFFPEMCRMISLLPCFPEKQSVCSEPQ